MCKFKSEATRKTFLTAEKAMLTKEVEDNPTEDEKIFMENIKNNIKVNRR